jgi:hypothetical protein
MPIKKQKIKKSIYNPSIIGSTKKTAMNPAKKTNIVVLK